VSDPARPARLVVFDLDGTLADSSPGILACLHLTLRELGRDRGDDDLLALIGPPLTDSFASLGFVGDALDDVVERYREHYDRVGVDDATIYPGVADALGALTARGARLAVATAKRVDFAQRMLDAFALSHYFDEVAGASIDGRVTDKDVIVAALLADLAPVERGGAWLVGDRRHDVAAARANGLVPVGALWGYGSRAELEGAGAAWLVERPGDLVAAFDERDGGR